MMNISKLLSDCLAGVLTVSLSCGAVIALLLLCKRPLERLKPGARYLCWLLVLVRLAVPVTLPLLPSGLALALPLPAVEANSDTDAAAEPVQPDTSVGPSESMPMAGTGADVTVQSRPGEIKQNEPLPVEAESEPNSLPHLPETGYAQTENFSPTKPEKAESRAQVGIVKENTVRLPDPVLLCAAVWLGVAAICFFVRLGRGLVYNIRLSRLGEPLRDERLLALYGRLCARYGVRRPPPLRICRSGEEAELCGSPLVYGFFHPTILLPAGTAEADGKAWDSSAFAGVAAHELTHVRRGDIWLKLLALWAVSLHWFNPLAYAAARQFASATELSCDAAVLAGCDEEARRGYGYVLLSVLRRQCRGGKAELTTRFNPARRAVKERFASILDLSPKRRGRALVALLLVVCLCMGSVVACRFGRADGEDTTNGGTPETTDSEGEAAQSPNGEGDIPLSLSRVEPVYYTAGEKAAEADGWETVCAIAEGALSFRRNPDDYRLYLIWNRPYNIQTGGRADYAPEIIGRAVTDDVSLEWVDLWGRSCVRAEYASGHRREIVYFSFENYMLMRILSAANSVVEADLDGDGSIELVANSGFMTPTYRIYTHRDGEIYTADLNADVENAFPDSAITYVHFDSSSLMFTCHYIDVQGEEQTEKFAYRDGMLCRDVKPFLVTDAMNAVIEYLANDAQGDTETHTSSYRLPRVCGTGASATNEAIMADFYAALPGEGGSTAGLMQLQLTRRGRYIPSDMLVQYGGAISRNVTYAVTPHGDGTATIDVSYALQSRSDTDAQIMKIAYHIAADGSLLSRGEWECEEEQMPGQGNGQLSACPALVGRNVYLKGNLSPDGSDYLLLKLDAERVYFVYYPDNGRLRYETGLTSVNESNFYLWQNYNSSVGMHYYDWQDELGGFTGSSFGDFRGKSDLLTVIDEAEYTRLADECTARMAREAADTSPAATVRLTTPIRNGDEDYLTLRVRVVNGSESDIFIPLAFTLEERNAAYEWVPVAYNGTPTFHAGGYTIRAGAEAVVDYDLSVYTELLESGTYYRVVVNATTGEGGEAKQVPLTCTFGGSELTLVSRTRAPGDWWYYAANDASYASSSLERGFTFSVELSADSFVSAPVDPFYSAPWRYIRFGGEGVKIFVPLLLFTDRETVERYAASNTLRLTRNGEEIALGKPYVRYSETMAVLCYTYQSKAEMERRDDMTLVLTFGTGQ